MVCISLYIVLAGNGSEFLISLRFGWVSFRVHETVVHVHFYGLNPLFFLALQCSSQCQTQNMPTRANSDKGIKLIGKRVEVSIIIQLGLRRFGFPKSLGVVQLKHQKKEKDLMCSLIMG
jgi:hypothetical protein